MLSRREFLQASALTSLAAFAPAAAAPLSEPLLIIVHLRGGWDGLHALAPISDPVCVARDRQLGLSGRSALLNVPSDQPGTDWRLHPRAAALGPLFAEGGLAALPRFGPAFPPRDHLDARQQIARAKGRTTGWLTDVFMTAGQPLVAITPAHPPLDISGMGACVLSQAPCTLIVRGGKESTRAVALARASCPSGPSPAAELVRRIFSNDIGRPGKAHLTRTLEGITMALEEGLDVVAAVVEVGGWDTHERQAEVMDDNLADLAGGLSQLWKSLRSIGRASWTRVVVLSDFGRALNVNAEGGTEHGHAGTALVLGGGRSGVLGTWEPLRARQTALVPDRTLAAASPAWARSLAEGALEEAVVKGDEAKVARALSPESGRCN